MQIKKIGAKIVKDSRGEKTIKVIVKTSKGKFSCSAPAGKSKGKFEFRSYAGTLLGDIGVINNLNVSKLNSLKLRKFEDLIKIERLTKGRLGANSLFALEASLLKAMACENGQELFRFLNPRKINIKIRSVGNAVGGGLHSVGIRGKRPDFQEFLFIAENKSFAECIKINEIAYKLVRKFLGTYLRNDEGAWETSLTNEDVLMLMDNVRSILIKKGFKVDIGLDVAASSFFDTKNKEYVYKNPLRRLNKERQINYIEKLIKKYNLFYVEDCLMEEDFLGFASLRKKCKNCLIVGDDLIVTNPRRLKKAIKMKAVNGVIVKPNQIGSLIKVSEVVKLAQKNGIKIIISHRSGETKDDTIADLAVGFGCDFIKTGIYGKVRKAKLKRLMKIEKRLKNLNYALTIK